MYDQIRAAIVAGRVQPGQRLPSTRELAGRLAVSRTTVGVAFDRLLAEGFVHGRVGAGTFVSATPHPYTDERPATSPLRPRPVWDGLIHSGRGERRGGRPLRPVGGRALPNPRRPVRTNPRRAAVRRPHRRGPRDRSRPASSRVDGRPLPGCTRPDVAARIWSYIGRTGPPDRPGWASSTGEDEVARRTRRNWPLPVLARALRLFPDRQRDPRHPVLLRPDTAVLTTSGDTYTPARPGKVQTYTNRRRAPGGSQPVGSPAGAGRPARFRPTGHGAARGPGSAGRPQCGRGGTRRRPVSNPDGSPTDRDKPLAWCDSR